MSIEFTVLFTKLPANPFQALLGTIPENAVKPSMGNGLLRVVPTAGRRLDGGFVNSTE